MNRTLLIIAASFGIFVLTFIGLVTLRLGSRGHQADGPGDATAPAQANPDNDPGQAKAEPGKDDPPKPEADKPAPPPARRPIVLVRWNLPEPEDKEKLGSYDRTRVHDVFFNPEGTRLITQTLTETVLWDASDGARLFTHQPEMRNVNRPKEKPDVQQVNDIIVAPGAQVVAFVSRDGMEVKLRTANTGRTIGTYKAMYGQKSYVDSRPPAFTPGGEWLLLCANDGNRDDLVAVWARNGKAWRVTLPPHWGKESSRNWEVLAPVPRDGILVRHLPVYGTKTGRHRVSVLNMKTGNDTPLSALDVSPSSSFPTQTGILVSPDGRYVLAFEQSLLQVCDLRTHRRVMSVKAESVHFWRACFTPDGQRLLVTRHPTYRERVFGTQGSYIRKFPPRVELYDIAGDKKIGEFVPKVHDLDWYVNAVQVSPDGKALALAAPAEMALVDFEGAFGVAPLPPLERPKGPEVLPLR